MRRARILSMGLLVLICLSPFTPFSDPYVLSAESYNFQILNVQHLGPPSHLKTAIKPTIQVKYDLYYYYGIQRPVDTVSVQIQLFCSSDRNSIASHTLNLDITGMDSGKAKTFYYDFPLYDRDGNYPLPDKEYYFRVTVDPGNKYTETNEQDNTEDSSTFRHVILSGRLFFGSIETTITEGSAVPGGLGLCPGSDYRLCQGANITWTNTWGSINLSCPALCANGKTNSKDGYSVDLTVTSGSVSVGDLSPQAAGVGISISGVTLDSTGMKYSGAEISLPDSVTAHGKRTDGRIDPRGFFSLSIGPGGPLSDPGEIQFSGEYYFHGYGLPFYVRCTGFSFELSDSSAGIVLNDPKPVYVHTDSFTRLADSDPRKKKAFPSNDILFFRGVSTEASITGDGLQGNFTFTKSSALSSKFQTHFPKGRITWGDFNVKVKNGGITKGDLGQITFTMAFSGDCYECGDPIPSENFKVKATAGITHDGAFGGLIDAFPIESRWGELQFGIYTYQKNDTGHKAVLYVPGFIITGTAAYSGAPGAHSPMEYLLGSREFTGANRLGKVYFLNESEAKKGNHYFAGLNLGPALLEPSVTEGISQLINDTQLNIRFAGQVSAVPFDVTEYTKYVMRPGGITGVFNTNFSGPIEIYGYTLEMKRFAFRQVMNVMDDKTLIDGSLDLPWPAELHVPFSNLKITCSGNFTEGEVVTCENGSGEGCNQALAYWNMPVKLLGMTFENTGYGSSPCPDPANRQLRLDTLNQVNGISQWVTLSAFWSPDGEPSGVSASNKIKITAPAQMRMDSPQGNTGAGFAIQMQDGYLNHPYSYSSPLVNGFTNLIAKVDIPLFNDITIHGHFENGNLSADNSLDPSNFNLYIFKDESVSDSDYDGVPNSGVYNSYSVTDYRDLLLKDDESMSPDPRPMAEYSWPSSGIIDLEYPLLYNRASEGNMPQFVGVKQEYGLPNGSPIFTVYSVPDYINPERTKLSFGASADVAALKNFHVDLTSLTGDLDAFLHNQLGVDDSFSLETLLEDLVESTNLMHDVTGGDLSEVIETALDSALNSNPLSGYIENLADTVKQIASVPSLITSQVEHMIRSAEEQSEYQLTNGLNSLLDELYNKLAPLLVYTDEQLDAAVAANLLSGAPGQQELTELRESLAQMKSGLATLINTLEHTRDSIQAVRDTVEDVRTLFNNTTSVVSGAIINVKGAVDTLSAYTSTNLDGNPILQELEKARGYLDDARAAISALNLGLIANTLQAAASLAGGSIDTSLIKDVEQFFESRIDELDELMDQAVSNYISLVESSGLPTIFDDAKLRIDFVEPAVNAVKYPINDLFVLILDSTDGGTTNDGGYIGVVDSGLSTLVSYLQSLEDTMNNLDNTQVTVASWQDLSAQGREKLDNLASSMLDDLAQRTDAMAFVAQSVKAGIQGGGSAFEAAFVDSLIWFIKAPMEQALGGFTGKLNEAADQVMALIPAMDADGIREMIKSAVLNSDPVQNLSEAFYEQFAFISDYIDDLATEVTNQINRLINEATAAIEEGLNSQLDSIKSTIGADSWGLDAAKIDGYAIVSQDEVERFRIEGEFTFAGDPDPTTYYAALDMTSWNAENGKGSACSDAGDGLIDVAISTHDVSADMLGCDIGIKEALLGFTLNGASPIGAFGYVYTLGELNFEALILSDMGLEAGVGAEENYLGAKANGRFESYKISAAFYFGRSCDFSVLERLDPEVAEFIGDRDELTGVYVRGSASIPIYNYGCTFTIGVGADIGAWYFADPPSTYGGLLGGSAYGKLLCIASLKGAVSCIGAKVGDNYQFSGSGWAAAGVGWCEPEDWDSISDSRSDSWCSTGDASFGATYVGSWVIDGPNYSCCH